MCCAANEMLNIAIVEKSNVQSHKDVGCPKFGVLSQLFMNNDLNILHLTSDFQHSN